MPNGATHLLNLIEEAANHKDLAAIMAMVTTELGFDYFALTHHVDLLSPRGREVIHLHNYPERWAEFYARNRFSVCDPVHRASHVTSIGFRWAKMPAMIRLTSQDRQMLTMGREQGIGDGFTVPVHVRGEAQGSCSFANRAGRPLPDNILPANIVGAYAFEAARRLSSGRGRSDPRVMVHLTDRQRDCVLWAARGKSDWEIGRILNISEETVRRHIKQACARYEVNKRILLVGRTLLDGTLTITDIIGRGYTPFWA